MLVTLIGKNSVNKVMLPKIVDGSYWISDKSTQDEKKLVNIQGKDGKWQIISNNYFKIVNPQYVKARGERDLKIIPSEYSVIKKVILKEYMMQYIQLEDDDDVYILYCGPICETEMNEVRMKKTSEIVIGRNVDCDISYNNPLIKNEHAKLFYTDNNWQLQILDFRLGVVVNSKKINKEIYNLENGDTIFILGLKIVIIGDILFINNPANNVKLFYRNLVFLDNKNQNVIEKNHDEKDLKLYDEKDYFSRAPRIVDKIECETIDISAPPAAPNRDEMPAFLALGSSISMGIMMVISMYSSIESLNTRSAGKKEIILRFGMTAVMLIAMIVFPIAIRGYQKIKKNKYERKRQQRYKKYINSKIIKVNEIMDKQRDILTKNYISSEECEKLILNKEPRLWERKIEDQDFLVVRLGTGDVPLDIKVNYPKETFSMEDDNLVEILNTIAEKSKILEEAPIIVSLAQKNISSIIVDSNTKMILYMKNIIMQIIALHSYTDLKLVFFIKKNNKELWNFAKMLPHVWDSTKQLRFFTDDLDDMKIISKYLEEIYENREEYSKDKSIYKQVMPYFLIITDDYKKIENLKIISRICKKDVNLGFSLLCITNDLTQLPNECKTFIDIKNEKGRIFESENDSTTQKEFKYNYIKDIKYENVCEVVDNIPIKYTITGSSTLPEHYSFLEMYDVGKIEQLNIYDRWNTSDATTSLKALVGIDDTGLPIYLDAHEKYHGPHGLIAGSTGSGKSEFIITYILSLAINFQPDDVNFVLIDYKGGGLAGAFKKREVALPHLVGTITNIETIGLQRSLDSIQSELRKRQIEFNKARELSSESTIDIYKYQRMYHDGIVNKAIPHLFIICDEFAELKQQQADFMDELISVARIGRSLGVHLILATQKPAGIVNDQIRSNSKFGVCLKVQEKSDSMDVIKKPDAAKLKRAGQFYINVGNDEYFALGQSGWAGAQYYPSDIIKKEIDDSIEFVDDIGFCYRKVNNNETKIKRNSESQGDQLTNIVKYIYDLAKAKGIQEKQLWLDSIPSEIFLNQIKKKYNVKFEKNIIEPLIGEYDDPFNQKQGALRLNLSKDGNTVIYGSADSGKGLLVGTIIYNTVTTHTTEEVQFYIMDFGSETLKIFRNTPHVGDVIFINDSEKILRLFESIEQEIKIRKEILSEYNGDYNLYKKINNNTMPTIIIIINNYGAFIENKYDEYDEKIQVITRECVKYGIVFVITATSHRDLRYKLIQNFKQKLVLQMNNDEDYLYIIDKVGKKRPSKSLGRGLVQMNNNEILEFQTAKICKDENLNEYLKKINEKLNAINRLKAKPISIMPEIVTLNDVKAKNTGIKAVPIGLLKKNLNVYTYDFQRKFINIITAKGNEKLINFAENITEELKMLSDIELEVFNMSEITNSEFEKSFSTFIKKLADSNGNIVVCVIIGLDKFMQALISNNDSMDNLISNTERFNNLKYIIVESALKLKAHQYEKWYKDNVLGDSGIWVGSGIDNQYVIPIETNRKEIDNSCGESYGYVVKQGRPNLVKLLGIKEDENG